MKVGTQRLVRLILTAENDLETVLIQELHKWRAGVDISPVAVTMVTHCVYAAIFRQKDAERIFDWLTARGWTISSATDDLETQS